MSFYTKHLNSFMLGSIGAGVLFGILLPEFSISSGMIGELFIRMLTLLIVPVIFFSMLSGVLNLEDSSSLARLGIKTLIYYTVTTGLAVLLGLLLVNIIQPGVGGDASALVESLSSQSNSESVEATSSFGDVLRNIIPTNIVQAAVKGNVLGLIFFSIFLGVALLQIPQREGREILQKGSEAVFQAIIWMIDKTMLLAPLGFLSLIADLVATFVLEDQLSELGGSIIWYSVTVMGGLILHGAGTLCLLAVVFGINPLRFFQQMFPAVTSAFSTASSSATLPITLDCLSHRAGVPNKIASFVAPLGATVNMDGTAIYEAVAVVFIANMLGVDLTFTEQTLIFITATVSAVGAAGIPGAGLIMMVLILNTVGLPPDGVKLVIVVDRVLDMLRTAINVWGDSIGAAIIAKHEKDSVSLSD